MDSDKNGQSTFSRFMDAFNKCEGSTFTKFFIGAKVARVVTTLNKKKIARFWKVFDFAAANAVIFYIYAKRKEHNLRAAGQAVPEYYKTALYARMMARSLRFVGAACFMFGLAMLLSALSSVMPAIFPPAAFSQDMDFSATGASTYAVLGFFASSCTCFLARLIDMFRKSLSPETEPVKPLKPIMDLWCWPASLFYSLMWKWAKAGWYSLR